MTTDFREEEHIEFVQPTPPVGLTEDETNFREDKIDILRRYDEAVNLLISVFTPNKKVKKVYKIAELESMDVPQLRVLAKILDVHDETDRKDVLIKSVYNAQRIPVVIASPQPAYATQQKTTGRKEGSPLFYTQRYPVISILRMPLQDDQARFNRTPRRKLAWTQDGNAVLQAWQPNPVKIPYQIEFISFTTAEANAFHIWIERLFSFPYVRFMVDHGYPYGNRAVFAFSESSFQDQTEYEQNSETAEKLIRHIYTIIVDGWIPTQMWITPTVRKVTTQFVDSTNDSEDVLSSNTEILEDIYLD